MSYSVSQSATSVQPFRLAKRFELIDIPNFDDIHGVDVNIIHPDSSASFLVNLHDITLDIPSDNLHTLVKARHGWDLLSNAAPSALSLERDTVLLRAHLMLGHWAWWCFLAEFLGPTVDDYLAAGSTTASWLFRIVAHVHRRLGQFTHAQNPSCTITFADVFPLCRDASLFKVAELHKIRVYSVDDELREDLIRYTGRVITQWLGLQAAGDKSSRNDDWDLRGRLVDMIIDLNQPGILLIPEVYQTFLSPSVAFPSLDTNGQLVFQCLKSAFVHDSQRQLLIQPLTHLLKSSVPSEFALLSSQAWEMPLHYPSAIDGSLQENEADIVDPDSNMDNSQPTPMDIDWSPEIVSAGNAVCQYLLDIQELCYTRSRKKFSSIISAELVF